MPLGVLMLDTRFRRFVGDIGNPESYKEPVLFEVVRGATVDKVVPAKAPPLIEDFVAAGERLIARGADTITTGCGFLVLNQAELAARLSVPVATSALLLIPSLLKVLPSGKRLGVMRFSMGYLPALDAQFEQVVGPRQAFVRHRASTSSARWKALRAENSRHFTVPGGMA